MDLHLLCPRIHLSINELRAFEHAGITTLDLVTLNVPEVSSKVRLPIESIQRISRAAIEACTRSTTSTAAQLYEQHCFLTTGDSQLDELLGGGIPVGHITEIVGESGIGKSQLACQLCVTAQLPVSLGGLGKQAVYLSTESGLATSRAIEMSTALREQYASKTVLPDNVLDGIHFAEAGELDAQDHMLYYHLPRLLEVRSGKIGLLVMDSVAANYRAEFEGRGIARHSDTSGNEAQRRARGMGHRSKDLQRLSNHLRKLALEYKLAIVVINQVSDRMSEDEDHIDVMKLNHQSQWFNGWTLEEHSPKVPALGLIWTNAVHVRLALKRKPLQGRELTVVYSPFCASASMRYEISTAGIRHI
jgi:DNA repair protein RAD57